MNDMDQCENCHVNLLDSCIKKYLSNKKSFTLIIMYHSKV